MADQKKDVKKVEAKVDNIEIVSEELDAVIPPMHLVVGEMCRIAENEKTSVVDLRELVRKTLMNEPDRMEEYMAVFTRLKSTAEMVVSTAQEVRVAMMPK